MFSVWLAIAEACTIKSEVPHLESRDQAVMFRSRLPAESFLRKNRIILNQDRRWPDWFAFKRFRVTGAIVGDILLEEPMGVNLTNLPALKTAIMGSKSALKSLMRSLFLSARWTEDTMRWMADEGPVLKELEKKLFIWDLLECSIVVMKNELWMARSRDDTAFLYGDELGIALYSNTTFTSVDSKISVASSSLEEAIPSTLVAIKSCCVDDAISTSLAPKHYLVQIVH